MDANIPGLRFFKWILSSENMTIPRAFVARMQGVLANTVILRDRYENLWRVEVARIGDDLCFDEGWTKFYEENSVELGNFMVFEYKGGCLFDFKLFGKNSLEKEGVGAFKFSVKQEDQGEPKDQGEGRAVVRQDNGETDEDDEDGGDDSDDEDHVREVEEDEEDEQFNFFEKAKLKDEERGRAIVQYDGKDEEYDDDDDDGGSDNNDDSDDEDIVQEVEEDEEDEQFNISGNGKPKKRNLSRDNISGLGKTPSTCKCRIQNIITKRKDDEGEEQVHISKKIDANSKSKSYPALDRNLSRVGTGTIPSRRRYRKKNVPDCYGADIFISGQVPKPKNPYFVTRSRTSRQNELYIPREVILDYHLEIPKKLFLVDEEGRKWKTIIKQWKDGRLSCAKGWKSLCNVNNIGHDDVCFCEFVQDEGSMDVHILVHVVGIAGT